MNFDWKEVRRQAEEKRAKIAAQKAAENPNCNFPPKPPPVQTTNKTMTPTEVFSEWLNDDQRDIVRIRSGKEAGDLLRGDIDNIITKYAKQYDDNTIRRLDGIIKNHVEMNGKLRYKNEQLAAEKIDLQIQLAKTERELKEAREYTQRREESARDVIDRYQNEIESLKRELTKPKTPNSPFGYLNDFAANWNQTPPNSMSPSPMSGKPPANVPSPTASPKSNKNRKKPPSKSDPFAPFFNMNDYDLDDGAIDLPREISRSSSGSFSDIFYQIVDLITEDDSQVLDNFGGNPTCIEFHGEEYKGNVTFQDPKPVVCKDEHGMFSFGFKADGLENGDVTGVTILGHSLTINWFIIIYATKEGYDWVTNDPTSTKQISLEAASQAEATGHALSIIIRWDKFGNGITPNAINSLLSKLETYPSLKSIVEKIFQREPPPSYQSKISYSAPRSNEGFTSVPNYGWVDDEAALARALEASLLDNNRKKAATDDRLELENDITENYLKLNYAPYQQKNGGKWHRLSIDELKELKDETDDMVFNMQVTGQNRSNIPSNRFQNDKFGKEEELARMKQEIGYKYQDLQIAKFAQAQSNGVIWREWTDLQKLEKLRDKLKRMLKNKQNKYK